MSQRVFALLRRVGPVSVSLVLVAAFVACGSDDEGADDGFGSSNTASTAFVPGDPPPMPALPPGAGPHGLQPNPTSTGNPMQDAAPNDSGSGDAATDTSPVDASGQ